MAMFNRIISVKRLNCRMNSFKFFPIYFGVLFCVSLMTGQGSVFDAIQPGKSTGSEVRARFGDPVRSEISGDIKVEHFNDEENFFKEVSGWFDSQDILQWVRIELHNEIDPTDAALLFGLIREPDIREGHAFDDEQGAKGETRHFFSEGVHLYVEEGKTIEIWLTQSEAIPDEIFAQIKNAQQKSQLQAENESIHHIETESQSHQQEINQTGEKAAYFGMLLIKHSGEGLKIFGVTNDTPAQYSGLQKGDLILGVDEISFYDKGNQPELFLELIKNLPPERPLRFHIDRKAKRFDIWIKPLRLSQEEVAEYQRKSREQFTSDYVRGMQLMAEDNYVGAIEHFQKSLKSNSNPMESYQGLGICCYHLGKHKEARKYFERAIKLDKRQPLSWFYGAANMDALGKRNGAMDGYKRYLKLNHDNPEMNAFARRRLDELKKRRKSDWQNRLLQIIDTIKKEIEK